MNFKKGEISHVILDREGRYHVNYESGAESVFRLEFELPKVVNDFLRANPFRYYRLSCEGLRLCTKAVNDNYILMSENVGG